MARIIYSGLVQSINGSIGGTTFQRNAYGFTIKSKPNIVNPNRQRQQPGKAALQAISQRWREITQAQRDSWQSYAIANPQPSRLNPNSFLTGQALFTRTNLLNSLYGAPIADACATNAQAVFNLGETRVQRVGSSLIFYDSSDDSFNSMRVLGYISATIPQTRTYDRSETRFMGVIFSSIQDDVNVTTPYLDQFGRLPQVNDFVFLRRLYQWPNTAQLIEYPAERIQVVA